MLRSKNDSPEALELASRVRSIAFLGTPHAGSDKSRWGELARRFVDYFSVLGFATNKEIVKNLDPNKSEPLARIGRDFPEYLETRLRDNKELEIMCFFEEVRFRMARMRKFKVKSSLSRNRAKSLRLTYAYRGGGIGLHFWQAQARAEPRS